MEEFIRLYQGDNGRLMVKDTRGRMAAHQASARNRVNILQYIYAQQSSEYNFRRFRENTSHMYNIESLSIQTNCLATNERRIW